MSNPQPICTDQTFYTVNQVAQLLQVSPKTVWTWTNSGVLPVVRLGPAQRLVRIQKSDLDSFLRAQSGQTAAH